MIHTELRKKSVTLRVLWVEYREAHPDGYGDSQFCALYRVYTGLGKYSNRVHEIADHQLILEWMTRLKPGLNLKTSNAQRAALSTTRN